ncbi:MAG: hypothetical protein GY906_39505 [bacterium]|nr:hypothetical protein [bacterium]
MKTRFLQLLLAASLAFNLGFAGALAGNYIYSAREPVLPKIACNRYPQEYEVRCNQLAKELDPLRHRQAEGSRLLAELLEGQNTEPQEIAECLDRLSVTNRRIQGLVVNAVLDQKMMLPDTDQAEFCAKVHMSLCKPWGGCRNDSCSLCDTN